MKHRRLQELGESDFEIVDGHPDIRGWEVKDGDGKIIGEVEELILDAKKSKVRYMVVEFEDNEFDLDDDREVLIPIGMAELHHDDDEVILPNITAQQLHALPEYDEDHLDPEAENRICMALGRTSVLQTGTEPEENFYQHEHFNDENLYRRRLLTQQNKANTLNSENLEEKGYRLRQAMQESERDEKNMQSRELERNSVSTGLMRDEEIKEGETVPVRNIRGDIPDENLRNDLSDREDPTGDNIRNVQEDLRTRYSRNRDDDRDAIL